MQNELVQSRIIDAGVDTALIARYSVLIKVGDISSNNLRKHPAYALSRGLAALGFGAIHLCGSPDYFDALDESIRTNNFWQHPGVWLTYDMANNAPETNIVIDLTNELELESFCSHLAEERCVPCLFTAWGESWAAISSHAITADELLKLNLLSSHTNDVIPPISRILAGLTLQETLVLTGKLDLAAPLEKTVVYNAAPQFRPVEKAKGPWRIQPPIENVVIEVVGAGAVGIHLLESLVPVLADGCELRIFDFDFFGLENTPFSYCENTDVGRAKAEVMAERIVQSCHPALKISPFVMSYQERPDQLSLPTVRIVCADNFKVRYYANSRSLVDQVPLVEAGSSTLAAQQRTYYPGRTACLAHRIHDLAAKADNEEQPASCSTNRALTLPGTNMVVGGMLAVETMKVLRPERFGWPSKATIVYDVRARQRFGLMDYKSPCRH